MRVRTSVAIPPVNAVPPRNAKVTPDIYLDRLPATTPRRPVDALYITDDEYLIQLPDRLYRVRGTSEIGFVSPADPPDTTDIHYLFGRCLGALMVNRGAWVLHAAVIANAHGAIAIVGASGMGKSTLAAALYTRGFRVISDDHCVVHDVSDPIAAPAAAALKLSADAREALLPQSKPLDPTAKKSFTPCPNNVSDAPAPLRAIFILDDTDVGKIEHLSRAKGALRLLQNLFAPELVRRRPGLEVAFAQTSHLVLQVPVFTLGRAHDFQSLRLAATQVEKTMATLETT